MPPASAAISSACPRAISSVMSACKSFSRRSLAAHSSRAARREKMSGRLSLVRSLDLSRRHAATSLWSPEKRTSGTRLPLHSAGLVYCGYSSKSPSNVSASADPALWSTPGTRRPTASISTIAASSPPVRT